VVTAVFAALDGDAQVTEDQPIAEVPRAQSASASCATAPPDRPRRPGGRASAHPIAG